jgi:NADH-quinone oxidoreductase subunit N
MVFFPAIGEVGLAVAALGVVLGGVSTKPSRAKFWSFAAIVALLAAGYFMVSQYTVPETLFNDVFVHDNLSVTFKAMIAIASAVAVLLSVPFLSKRGENKFEYPLLILLATVGMFGMVSSQDFLALYVSLELQSLALYVLASFRRDHRRNSEAGLKYFFLGALSSGLLLYGISLIYGFVGSTSYSAVSQTLAQTSEIGVGATIGLVLTLSGLAFKVSAVPFHMWTPDVYQGSPTPVTAFFATAPKVAAIGVLCRLMQGPLSGIADQVQPILAILSLASMLLGAFAGVVQKNIKRLMAYSAIGHIGFILMGLASGTASGVSATVFYAALYLMMTAGGFAFILYAFDDTDEDENIESLAGYAKTHPQMAACFAAILLSMAGIPPLAGFFAKLVVLKAAIESDLTWLAVIGVLASVVSAYYYIRIIKIMYFDEVASKAPQPYAAFSYKIVASVAAVAMIVLLVVPQPLAALAQWAAGIQ